MGRGVCALRERARPQIEEGSHRGLVRAPAKRLSGETWIVGSNPTPSAIIIALYEPAGPPGLRGGFKSRQ